MLMQDSKKVISVHRALATYKFRLWGTILVSICMLVLGIFWTYRQAIADSTESSWVRSATGGYVGHWELNIDTDTLWLDAAMRQMFDINNPALTLDNFTNTIHPDDLEYVNNKLEETIKFGNYYEVAYRILDRQGTTRYITSRGILFTKLRLFSGVCIPISKENYENTVSGRLTVIYFNKELQYNTQQLIRTRGIQGKFAKEDYVH
jgi:hypothetical protein